MDSKAEIPTPTDHASSKEFPTDPEKRFEAIFAAIGNSEAKCLTLLCLSESPVSPRDLYHQFTTQNNGSWEPNKSTPAEYCEQTLVPIGLVAYADVIRQGTLEHTTGYRLTVAGKKFQPISAFLTEKSCGLPYSLIEIFGATHTRGKSRSAINRSRIMEFLSSNPNAKVIDIAKSIGISPGLVGNHLRHLSKLGILEFSSINAENPGSVGYVVNKDINVDEIKSKKKLGLLSSRVIDFLMDKDSFTLEEAARAIHNYYPDVEFNSFRGKLSKTMVSLEKDGIFHRSTFSSKLRSRASLTEIGNKIVNEIVSPIKEVLSGNEDLLAQWSRIKEQRKEKQQY